MMTAELISMGTVYLMGMLEEPVHSYLAGRMTELGVQIQGRRIIADDKENLKYALDDAFQHVQTVVLTGGSRPAYSKIRDMLSTYMGNDSNNTRLLIPSRTGNTEGYILRDTQDRVLIVLPGNETEVEDMFEDDVVGYLLKDVADGKSTIVMTASASNSEEAADGKERLDNELSQVIQSANPSVQIKKERDRITITIAAVGPTKGDAMLLAQMMAGDIKRRTEGKFCWQIKELEE